MIFFAFLCDLKKEKKEKKEMVPTNDENVLTFGRMKFKGIAAVLNEMPTMGLSSVGLASEGHLATLFG